LTLILAGLAQAQTNSPLTPYGFSIDTNAFTIIVVELNREGLPPIKGKMLIREMQVTYHVATSELAEDRAVALLLGASSEDASQINRVAYSGAAWAKSPRLRYALIEFYADDRLVAVKQIGQIADRYNLKGRRIYQLARALYDQKKKKAGR